MMNLEQLLEYPYSWKIDDSIVNTYNIHLTSIIILTYNQLEYTKLCIESIRKFTPKYSYELIVVDNNSTDGTVNWLKEQDDIKLILNNENLGFPKGCNQGIEIAKGDNILLLNNDTIVTPNWLYNLDYALWQNPQIGAVGCVSNFVHNNQQISVDYKNISSMLDFALNFNKLNLSKHEERKKLIGFCMMIKKDIVNKIGLLDERFSPGHFEDDDYSLRIIISGHKLLLCKDTFIHHFGSISFKKNPNMSRIFQINKQKFKEKWNLK